MCVLIFICFDNHTAAVKRCVSHTEVSTRLLRGLQQKIIGESPLYNSLQVIIKQQNLNGMESFTLITNERFGSIYTNIIFIFMGSNKTPMIT